MAPLMAPLSQAFRAILRGSLRPCFPVEATGMAHRLSEVREADRTARRWSRGTCIRTRALRWAFAALVPVATLAAAPVRAGPALPGAAPSTFAAAIQRALPVTVGIYAVGRSAEAPPSTSGDLLSLPVRPAPRDEDRAGAVEEGRIGAGFVVDRAGWIATAAHVVSGAQRIIVKLSDRRVVPAVLVGADEDSDIALLRVPIALPEPHFTTSDHLRAGDWVLAVGEPYGFSGSVAAGIVGGLDRHLSEEPELLFIQSDLAINPGNSGGPLIDATGAVVGMNSRNVISTFGAAGVSLSVPVEIVMRIVADLRENPSRARPKLGATFQDVSPPAALAAGRPQATGVLIGGLVPDGLAEKAGIEAGDIVVGINGRPVADSAGLVRALRLMQNAERADFTIWRDRQFIELRGR
jgi:S1-C subfamily serine protease